MDFITNPSTFDIYMGIRRDLLQQKETILMTQLSNLVREGVLLIEETETVLVQDFNPTDPLSQPKITLRQAVRLTWRGEEVLESYRKKVERMEKAINELREALNAKD